MALMGIAKKVFGSTNDRRLKPLWRRVAAINAFEEQLAGLSDTALAAKTPELKKRFADGETLDSLLEEAFAIVREAAKRALGQRHYDVQLVGGMVLHQDDIAEMKTGEGKTLVATLPVYLNALTGRGVHVITVNDYLASRDAEWMGRVYSQLGMTTGVIVHGLDDEQRREAYAADITYGTNNEFGFDYLRDNMKGSLEEMVQRGHHFAIVDEVDSILIDEARTPLIISGPTDDKSELYIAIDALMPQLTEADYEVDEKVKSVSLTEDGHEHIEKLLIAANLLQDESLYDASNVSVVHHVNQALKAHKNFMRDRDYIVRDDKVTIIDEFTGRMMDGRRWSDGLHQAVEAKEKVTIQPENQTLASITFQNYFRLYEKLAGMTGTALTEEAEFADIYDLNVLEIPTNKPIARQDMDDELYMTAEEKYKSIVLQIVDCVNRNQPCLVGTVSIENSELLSNLLSDKKNLRAMAKSFEDRAGDLKDKEVELKEELLSYAQTIKDLAAKKVPIPHNVLNARYHEQEAEIIAGAGVPGAVTIATNMAGRGTDIQLGGSVDLELMASLSEDDDEDTIARKRQEIEQRVDEQKQMALDAGGLFVLATERHESRRIDNQLRGRSGRQGDPGTTKFFLSLEDDLMRIFGSGMEKMLKRFGIQPDESIEHPWFTKAVETAQKKVEQSNFDQRKQVLKYDDVKNDQRKAIFDQRIEFMSADSVDDILDEMRENVVEDMVSTHIPAKSYAEQWDVDGLSVELDEVFGKPFRVKKWAAEEGVADTEILERLMEGTKSLVESRERDLGADNMRKFEKAILLHVLDNNWREHLQQLDQLQSVVGLRAHGQRDPINEFKTEAFSLFEDLLHNLRRDVLKLIMHFEPQTAQQAMPERPAGEVTETKANPRTGENQMDRRPARKSMSAGHSTSRARRSALEIDPNDPSTWGRVSRNAPCPCGSGQKYKTCHGSL